MAVASRGRSNPRAEGMLPDAEVRLLEQIRSGDAEAGRRFVREHYPAIYRYLLYLTGQPELAEDLTQETFLQGWQHLATFQGRASLRTWLHRIALNLCLDRLARRRETPLDEVDELVDPKPHTTVLLQGQNLSHQVGKAVDELPDSQRIAITLCYYQGLPNKEAAQTMEISVEALESLLARGRRTLKSRLRAVAPDLLGDAS